MSSWWLLGLAVYALTRSLAYAAMRPLSIDELFTQTVCHQASLPAIWKALSQGADGQPPFFYLIQRSTVWSVLNEHLGYRLLPALAFVCTLILMYVFVRTRNGSASASVAACLLLMTPLFTIYSAEARPYSPLTACIAIALVCYQRAPAVLWVVGLFVSLVLASSLHYYALFAVFPFFLAEVTVVYEMKKVRFLVWFALLGALAPLGIYWPLVLQVRQHWTLHPIASTHVSIRMLPLMYAWYLGVAPAWAMALVGAAVAVLAGFLPVVSHPEEPKGQEVGSLPERLLVIGLIVSPMVGWAVTTISHAPILDRYFLPAILGIAAAAGYVLRWATRRSVAAALIVILIAVGVQELAFWSSPRHRVVPAEQLGALATLAETVDHEDLPIVVSGVEEYREYWHYAPPELRRRIVALVDPANAWRYVGGDYDQLHIAQRLCEPMTIQDFDPFAAAHPVFLLLSTGSPLDWWPARLAHDGHRLQVLATKKGTTMYLVQLSDTAGRIAGGNSAATK